MLKKAIQTITWGDPQHDLFEYIFDNAQKAGFDGLEIGFRRLIKRKTDDIKVLLEKYNIQISASHVGGNLADLTQADDEKSGLENIINVLIELGIKKLVYSGLNVTEDKALNAEIHQIKEFSERCADHDILLLYHNHDWEFRNNMYIWKRLLEAEIKSLGYAPDLGWAVKSGYKILPLLNSLNDSIKILHFKDFFSWDGNVDTCHLGEGIIDFTPAWNWLSDKSDRDIWLTAEQDNAEDADKACNLNGSYLNKRINLL